MLLLPGLHMQIKILLSVREVNKAAEKDTSTSVVTSIHSTGATVVGSINVTEFWQRRTWPPSYLLLLSHRMDLTISQ